MKLMPETATRYLAVGSVVLCTGFGLVGVAQTLRQVPDLVGSDVPVVTWLADAGANAVSFIGLPVYKWAAKTNIVVIKALPMALRRVVISTFERGDKT